MGRRSTGPRYWASRGGWYCWHRGVQHCLGKSSRSDREARKAAQATYDALERSARVCVAGDGNRLADVLQSYLAWCGENRKPRTHALASKVLLSFIASVDGIPVSALKVHAVESWLRGRGPTSRRIYHQFLRAALNWAVAQDIISRNPIAKKISLPPPRSRGREILISPEEHARLVAGAKPAFAEFCTVLEATGARPGELSAAEARNYSADLQALVLEPEQRKVTRKERVIFLPPAVLAIVLRRVSERPSGTLWRTTQGLPWTTARIEAQFCYYRRRLGLNPRFCAYSYRHTFATRWLLAGLDIMTLAQVMGTSVKVIEHHYAHLIGHKRIREQLLAFSAESGGT